MFKSNDVFKFYIYQHNVFTFENALNKNQIEFINEKIIGTNSRSLKYYIKNSDREKLDLISKDLEIEIFIDSLPNIETRFPKINITYPKLILILIVLILFLSLII